MALRLLNVRSTPELPRLVLYFMQVAIGYETSQSNRWTAAKITHMGRAFGAAYCNVVRYNLHKTSTCQHASVVDRSIVFPHCVDTL